jgi:hypothetical protein
VNDIPPHSPFAASPMFSVATVPSENCRIGSCGHEFGYENPFVCGSKFGTRALGTTRPPVSRRP